MRMFGYLLVTLSFLGSSFVAVRETQGVSVPAYLVALAIGIVGVIVVRTAMRREASHEETLSANIGAIEESLAAIVAGVEGLEAEKDEIDVYDLRHRIDDQFPPHLDRFVLARKSIGHLYGLQAYADVMNPFAAGERYLNRVWSTSTDGYIDEAHLHITKSKEQFEDALRVFRGLGA